MSSSGDDDFVKPPNSRRRIIVSEDNEKQEVGESFAVQPIQDDVSGNDSSNNESCGSDLCKGNPSGCLDSVYKQVLLDVATRRGFKLSEKDLTKRKDRSLHLKAMQYVKFCFSLDKNPEYLSGGSCLFFDDQSYSIVLHVRDDIFVPFCSSFRCIRKAEVCTDTMSLCRLPKEFTVKAVTCQYALFFFIFGLSQEEVETNDGSAWNRVLESVKVSGVLGKKFGHYHVNFKFVQLKVKGSSEYSLVLRGHFSNCGRVFYMCQDPFCGRVGVIPFLRCANESTSSDETEEDAQSETEEED